MPSGRHFREIPTRASTRVPWIEIARDRAPATAVPFASSSAAAAAPRSASR